MQNNHSEGKLIGKDERIFLATHHFKVLNLVYSSAIHPKDAKTIYEACKGKTDLIVVCKSKETGKVFGGRLDNCDYYELNPILFSFTEKKFYPATYEYEYESGGSCQDCPAGNYRKSEAGSALSTKLGPMFGEDFWVEPGTLKGHSQSVFFTRDVKEMSGGEEFTCELYEIYEAILDYQYKP
jgi:hypothetical protein